MFLSQFWKQDNKNQGINKTTISQKSLRVSLHLPIFWGDWDSLVYDSISPTSAFTFTWVYSLCVQISFLKSTSHKDIYFISLTQF